MTDPAHRRHEQTPPVESLSDPGHSFPGEDDATGSEGSGRTIGMGADEQAKNAYEDARDQLPEPRPRKPR
jgi:hypothetical protein